MSLRGVFVALPLFLWAAAPGRLTAASCSSQALNEIREAVEPLCPCLGAATSGAYKRCVKAATKELQTRLPSLTTRCRKAMMRATDASTCGRPGATVCCRGTTKRGKARQGVIARSADTCVRKNRGQACQAVPSAGLGAFPNSIVDCDAAGQCPITATSSTTTSITEPPASTTSTTTSTMSTTSSIVGSTSATTSTTAATSTTTSTTSTTSSIV